MEGEPMGATSWELDRAWLISLDRYVSENGAGALSRDAVSGLASLAPRLLDEVERGRARQEAARSAVREALRARGLLAEFEGAADDLPALVISLADSLVAARATRPRRRDERVGPEAA